MSGEEPSAPRGEGPSFERVGRRFRAPLLIRQFPPEVPFGFVGRILPTTETIDLTVEAHRIDPARALAMLHRAQSVAAAELVAGGNGASPSELDTERVSAEDLGREIARRTQELWKVGVRFVAMGPSRARVEAVRARLEERLARFGFRIVIPRFETAETLAPVCAFTLLGAE